MHPHLELSTQIQENSRQLLDWRQSIWLSKLFPHRLFPQGQRICWFQYGIVRRSSVHNQKHAASLKNFAAWAVKAATCLASTRSIRRLWHTHASSIRLWESSKIRPPELRRGH